MIPDWNDVRVQLERQATTGDWDRHTWCVALTEARRRWVEAQLEWSDAPGRQWVNATLDAKDAS